MIQRSPVLNAFHGIFGRTDPRKKAGLALARLLTQFDMEALPYDEGVTRSRRIANTRHVSIGVWLVPIDSDQSPDDACMEKAIPAATSDLRRQGIGVLMPVVLDAKKFIVAVADMDNVWRFFVANVRHQSARPGGWFQIGLGVESVWEPEPEQSVAFRERIENAFKV